MKKYFYSLLAALTMLTAVSCSQDDELMGANGKEQAVTFTVNLPGNTETRAIQQGVEVGKGNMATTLIWALYEDGKYTDGPLDTGTGHYEADKKFTATINMVKGLTYKVLFLAYNADNCAFEDVAAGDDLLSLTLKSDLKANQEAYDAFVACHEHEVNAEAVTTVTLTRPFAQVNAATTLADLQRAKKLKAAPTNTNLVIKDVPTVYNVLTGEATDNGAVSYKAAEILKTIDTQAEVVNEGIEVEDKDYYYLTMAYVLAGATATSDKSMHEATFEFYRDEEPTLVHTINIPNLPIQRNWRTNVIGDLLTQGENFQIVIDEKFIDDHNVQETVVDNAEDFLTALNNASEYSKIVMTNDIVLDGGTSAKYGAMDLKEVIIEGSKSESRSASTGRYTLTFKDSYRTYINLNNPDAKIVFNNVNINRETTNTNTHWHNNNMKFCCNAEFNNVDFNKGICFDNAKTFVMNNCSINKGKVATYALFITAGCDVTIDGLSVTHSEGVAGRGIKIVDEDVAEPTLTTLSVSNSKFVTASKAAVLVGSKAGANITWGEGNDISGVAADQMNAVWVDEDYKNIEDVTVTGCTVVVEGTVGNSVIVRNAEELQAAINAAEEGEGYNVIMFGDNITATSAIMVPQQKGVNLLINGDDYKFDGVFKVHSNSNRNNDGLVTFTGINFETETNGLEFILALDFGNSLRYSQNITVDGCTFTAVAGSAAEKTAVGIKVNATQNLNVKNCTATNMHSFMQAQSCDDKIVVDNVTVEGCKNGISFGNTAYPTISNSTINATAYGIRADGDASRGNLVVENTTINAKKPVIVRKTTTDGYSVKLGANVVLNTTEAFQVVFTSGDDEGAYVAPTKNYSFSGEGYNVFPVVAGQAMTASSTDQLSAILTAGATAVNLTAGTYVIPNTAQGKTLKIVGVSENPEDVKIATKSDGSYEGCNYAFDGSTVTFENISINTNSGTYVGYARCKGTYKNCIINGTYTLYDNSVFEDCTFNVSGDVYNIWTWGAPEATFTRCTFNSDGKAMLLYSTVDTKLTLNTCVFNDNGGLSDLKAAVEIGNDYDKSYELIVNNTTVNGYEINDKGINTGTTLWANKNSMGSDKLNVVIDGVDVY